MSIFVILLLAAVVLYGAYLVLGSGPAVPPDVDLAKFVTPTTVYLDRPVKGRFDIEHVGKYKYIYFELATPSPTAKMQQLFAWGVKDKFDPAFDGTNGFTRDGIVELPDNVVATMTGRPDEGNKYAIIGYTDAVIKSIKVLPL